MTDLSAWNSIAYRRELVEEMRRCKPRVFPESVWQSVIDAEERSLDREERFIELAFKKPIGIGKTVTMKVVRPEE